jgi:hypothetical protein
VNHFPLFTPPGHNNKHEHKYKPLLIIATILPVHEKEVLHASVTYHLFSTDVYQLSIAHQVDKYKYFYNKDDIRKGTIMQPITIIQDPTCSAQSTHAKISKISHVNHAIGSICIGACIAQEKKS